MTEESTKTGEPVLKQLEGSNDVVRELLLMVLNYSDKKSLYRNKFR